MRPEERLGVLSTEVYNAARHMAPHGWIMDYVEYFSETPPQMPTPTFADYLEFQLSTEEEDGDVNPPEYFEAIKGYLQEFYPGPEYCTYCHTYGHEVADCPETPMHKITVDLLVPASYHDPVEHVRQSLKLGDDIQVNDVFLEEE